MPDFTLTNPFQLSGSRGYIFNPNTLAYEAAQQSVLSAGVVNLGGAVAISNLPTTQTVTGPFSASGALTPASGQVSGLGNNTLITPASGKKLRVFYASYNPLLAVEAAFRFGAAGTLFLRNNVLANSVIAKDLGDFKYLEGAVGDALLLNLSLAVSTNWTVFYQEI